MEGSETLTGLCCTHDILFRFSLVCRWTYWFSSVPYQHQSGFTLSNAVIFFMVLSLILMEDAKHHDGLEVPI
jgi:hypothetical protein